MKDLWYQKLKAVWRTPLQFSSPTRKTTSGSMTSKLTGGSAAAELGQLHKHAALQPNQARMYLMRHTKTQRKCPTTSLICPSMSAHSSALSLDLRKQVKLLLDLGESSGRKLQVLEYEKQLQQTQKLCPNSELICPHHKTNMARQVTTHISSFANQ